MRGRFAILLGLGALLLGPAPSRAEDAPGVEAPASEMQVVVEAADAFWGAFQTKDEATQRAIAARRDLDLVRVLGALLRAYVEPELAGQGGGAQRLEAATALVSQAQGNPGAAGADRLLATWKGWDRKALEREGRLRHTADRVEALDPGGDVQAQVALLEGIRPELRPVNGSLLACFLQQDLALLAWRTGRIEDALRDTRASRALAAEIPWAGGELRALRYEYSILHESGELDEMARVGREAREIALRMGWVERAMAAGLDTVANLRLGARYAEAIALAHEMQALALRVGDPEEAARALLAEAKTLAAQGETRRALELAERVRADPAHAANVLLQLEALDLAGFVSSRADRLAEALATTDAAFALLGERDDPHLRAHVWTNRGTYLRRLGQLEEALACQQQAVAFAERTRSAPLLGTALGNLGVVQRQLGRPEYRATLQRALETKRKAGDQIGVLETALNLGAELAEQPATRDQGLRLLEQARGALERANALPQLAATLTALTHAHRQAGRLEDAEASAARALELLQSIDDRSMRLAAAYEARATVRLALRQPATALDDARAALACRRALAAGLGEEDAAGLVLNARRSSDLALTCALALAEAEPGKASKVAAHGFEAVESGRATLLAAGVVQAEALLAAEVPAALVREEATARARVAGARARLVSASSRPTREAGAFAQARGQLDLAWKAYAAIVARIQREARRAAGVVFPAPVALEDLRKRLPRGTAYVAFQLGPDATIALVVRAEGASLVALGGAQDLTDRVEQYLRLASAPESDEEAPAAALYETLLRPLEPHLTGVERLLLSPDAALTFLPFEALRRVDGAKAERVIERWEVAYLPSATLLASLQEEHPKTVGRGFVGLGDPAYAAPEGASAVALTPLPRSGDEVRAVGALFATKERTLLLGKDASLERLLAAVPKPPQRLRALHLACHAFVDAERPRLSSLALSGGDTLDLDALYRLRVPADLCVLSACSTARGRLVQGEGVLGFVRGFFFAGVPRVVVSDWVVEDQSARTLMEAFHTGLAKGMLGTAAALRQAKLAALKAGGAAAHPSSWAAFVLWGLPD